MCKQTVFKLKPLCRFYEGKVYVNLKKDVNYGITIAISTKAIRDFYKDNREYLEYKGYYLEPVFE